MPKNNNLGPLLIILAFLVIVVVGYQIRENRWPGLPWSLGATPKNFTLLSEVSGGVVKDFPVELVSLAKDTKIQKSAKYSLDTEDGRGSIVLTTTYTTEASISELFAAYIEHLTNDGYTILKTQVGSGSSNIEAGSERDSVSVSIYLTSRNVKEVRVDVNSQSSVNDGP